MARRKKINDGRAPIGDVIRTVYYDYEGNPYWTVWKKMPPGTAAVIRTPKSKPKRTSGREAA